MHEETISSKIEATRRKKNTVISQGKTMVLKHYKTKSLIAEESLLI